MQFDNVLNTSGGETHTTTLGGEVAKIFNENFFNSPTNPADQRGVPLKRIDVSGYGASTFSDWVDAGAEFGATSEARFDIAMGRTFP